MSGKAACVQFVVYRKAEWVDDMEPLPCSFRSTMIMKPGRYVGCSAVQVTPHWARNTALGALLGALRHNIALLEAAIAYLRASSPAH
jgi:hypothetical protein